MAEAVYCKIEDGVVTQRALFDAPMPEDWAEPGDVWIENNEANIGWAYADGVFTAPPLPEPIPPPPIPPSQEEVVLFNHENRIRAQEGVPPLVLADFVEKKRNMTL